MDAHALISFVMELDAELALVPAGSDGANFRTPRELCEAVCRARPELSPDAVWQRVRDGLLAGGAPRDRLEPDVPFERLIY